MRARRSGSTTMRMIAEVTFGTGQNTDGGSTRTISTVHWL